MIKIKVKEYLKEVGITQSELAEKLGITPSALSKRISNNSISLQQLGEIANKLHAPISFLYEENGKMAGEVLCPNCGSTIKVSVIAK